MNIYFYRNVDTVGVGVVVIVIDRDTVGDRDIELVVVKLVVIKLVVVKLGVIIEGVIEDVDV